MRIMILGDRTSMKPGNDLAKLLDILGHHSTIFYSKQHAFDEPDTGYDNFVSDLDKADLVVMMCGLGTTMDYYFGYAVAKEKTIYTIGSHLFIPSVIHELDVPDIIQSIMKMSVDGATKG